MSLAVAVMAATLQGAAPCPPGLAQDLAGSTEEAPFRLICSLTLASGQTIVRPLLIEGAAASGVTIDCRGGTLGQAGRPVATSRPTVAIQSARVGARFEAPQDVTLRDCRIRGAVRIWGMGAGGDYDSLRASSRTAGHVAALQTAAPRRITLERVTITANGTIPLYVGPGVTEAALVDSVLDGRSDATAVYLDAESARNRLERNDIRTRTSRELIAVDGSAENRIVGNRLSLGGRAGVLLYRNCGERGVIRHQSPSNNRITDNSFSGANWLRPRLVVENARDGRRSYCDDDAGWPYGSSADDRDGGRDNLIARNLRR